MYNSADHVIRDVIVLAMVWFVCKKHKDIAKVIKCFLPVFVVGALYLFAAAFMMYRLRLDFGLQTFLSVFAGVDNNIFIVLVAALCFHGWQNKLSKSIYFLAYVFTGIVIIADIVYFWQTTMHVESVLFQNLNIYSIIGVLNSFDTSFVVAICLVLAIILLAFKSVKNGLQ